jgi:hypothetical protein
VCWAHSLGVILTPGPAQFHNLEKMRGPSVYPANPLALSAVMLFSAGRARPARFLEYPEPELSSELAENSMRPVALEPKNWIHIGGAQILAHRDFQLAVAFYHRKDRSDLRSRLFFLGKPSDRLEHRSRGGLSG